LTINSTSPRELIDTELDAVVGGNGFDFINAHQNAFAVGGNATAVNALGSVSNSASQVAAIF
jgi:hypothetical protein